MSLIGENSGENITLELGTNSCWTKLHTLNWKHVKFAVSLFVVVVTYGTCYGLKRLASDASRGPSLVLSLFLDFVTSVEFIVAAFELGIVLEHYGLAVWSICLYFSVTYQVRTMLLHVFLLYKNISISFQVVFWKEFGFPVPFDRMMEFVHGKVGAAEAIIRAATLLLTGKLFFSWS